MRLGGHRVLACPFNRSRTQGSQRLAQTERSAVQTTAGFGDVRRQRTVGKTLHLPLLARRAVPGQGHVQPFQCAAQALAVPIRRQRQGRIEPQALTCLIRYR